jgi:hypothetical protein
MVVGQAPATAMECLQNIDHGAVPPHEILS